MPHIARFRLSRVAIGGVSLAALAVASAAAETTPTPVTGALVQEVVVTARQRQENLKDVPAAISVLTASTLRAAGVSRAEDIVALTPGVSMVNGSAEQGDTQVNIRGINSARDADPSFALVIDGIQIANPAAFNREYLDLQQIEVVKGPQGASYGRNASAGAIIVTTDKPSDTPTAYVQGSAGNVGSYTAKFIVSGPIADRVTASLSGDFRRTAGQYNNSYDPNQHNLDYYQGGDINGRMYFRLDDATNLDLKARYGQLDAGAINFNAVFALPALATVTGDNAFYGNVNDHNFTYQNDVPQDNRQKAGEFSAKLDHDFGWATLTAWGLYSDIHDNLIADGTSASFGFFNTEPHCIASTAALYAQGVTLPAPQSLGPTPGASFFGPYTPTTCDGYQYQQHNQSDESLEIRLTSRSGQPLRWMLGAYYLHVDRNVGVATGIDAGGNPPRALYVPASSGYSTEQLLWDDFRSNVGAVFGQASYDILPGVEGSAALRFDSERHSDHNLVPTDAVTKYIDYNGPPYTGGAPLNPGLDPTLNPGGIHDQAKTYSQLQPKISLRWTVSPEVSVYGDWGIGFKSGGFNNAGSAATVNAFINPIVVADGFAPVTISDSYKKEVSSEFEGGAKARLFNGRLTLDGAVYEDTVDNMQFFEFFVGPFGLLRVVSNIDQVRLYGGELGAAWRVDDYFTLDATGAYTHSRINQNSVRPDTVGNKSPYTPDYTWNLAAQYDRPLTNDLKLHARLDVRGTGPTWFSDVQAQSNPTVFEASFGALGRANYSQTQRAAYETVDLRLGLERHGVTVTAFGQNILNEKYVNEVIPAAEFGGSFVSPGFGPRYGVEVGWRF
jgi:iron complex outermembrane receptor protein